MRLEGHEISRYLGPLRRIWGLSDGKAVRGRRAGPYATVRGYPRAAAPARVSSRTPSASEATTRS